MGVSLAGEIQREQRWGISRLPVHLYTEDKHQQRNKADIMTLGLTGEVGRVPDSPAAFRLVVGRLGGRSAVSKGFRQDGVRQGGQDEQRGFPLHHPPSTWGPPLGTGLVDPVRDLGWARHCRSSLAGAPADGLFGNCLWNLQMACPASRLYQGIHWLCELL